MDKFKLATSSLLNGIDSVSEMQRIEAQIEKAQELLRVGLITEIEAIELARFGKLNSQH